MAESKHVESKHVESKHVCYCPNCRPAEFKKLNRNNPDHHSIDFGDKQRVESVLFEGKEVRNDARACIAGRWGYVELLVTDRPIHQCACLAGACVRVRRGEVVVKTRAPRLAAEARSDAL